MSDRTPDDQVLGHKQSTLDISISPRKRFTLSQYANLRFELGDALSLDFDQEFDLVTYLACPHWIDDHLKC
jgi:hypothetical protein